MTRTLPEVIYLLKQLDEIELVELLGVTSEDIVDRFVDMIENDQETFDYKLEDYFPSEETDDDDSR